MKTVQLQDFRETSAEGFTKRMIHESVNGLVFLLNFQPGQSLPAHSHAESEVLLTVLCGQGELTVDGRLQAVKPGTAVHLEGKETLSARNTGTTPLSLLVFLYPGNPRFAGTIR
jgi:quercetin dioxygenase-like cupin family protein